MYVCSVIYEWTVCVCLALVISSEELEQPGRHTPRLHGLPDLRRGQGSPTQVHPQTGQVRHIDALWMSHTISKNTFWPGVSLSATSSGWAAPDWASGPSATWRLTGTSCRPSPTTNPSSRPSLMDTERDCESRHDTASMLCFIHCTVHYRMAGNS